MTFTKKLKEVFGYGEKPKAIEENLKQWGLNVLQDQKLEKKLLALQELFDELEAEITTEDPVEYVKELDKRLKMLNRAIHSLAAPNYRSGTFPAFRQMIEGWVLWNSLAEYWIHAVQDRIKGITKPNGNGQQNEATEPKPDSFMSELQVITLDVWTLVRRLHTVLQMHVFRMGS